MQEQESLNIHLASTDNGLLYLHTDEQANLHLEGPDSRVLVEGLALVPHPFLEHHPNYFGVDFPDTVYLESARKLFLNIDKIFGEDVRTFYGTYVFNRMRLQPYTRALIIAIWANE